jgi:hypothetical protein
MARIACIRSSVSLEITSALTVHKRAYREKRSLRRQSLKEA